MNLFQAKTRVVILKDIDGVDPTDAEILLAYANNESREHLLAHGNEPVSFIALAKFNKFIKKRKDGTPLAYITKQKEFFGLNFYVDQSVLIPRPETELLVELALDQISRENVNCQLLLVDVGTGSGCIPIAIKKTLQQTNTAALETYAIDSSKKALKIAKRNARTHRVNITFLHDNLLAPFVKLKANSSKLIITANLPYLTPKQYTEEKSIQFEPYNALVGGATGLELYEQLLKQIKALKQTKSETVTCFFEIDPSQTKNINTMIQNHLPNSSIEVKKDLCGLDRVVIIES